MRRHWLFIFIVTLCLPVALFANNEETLFVEINKAKLRSQPKFWAKAIQDVAYGDRLAVAARLGGWVEVTTSNGTSGFIHESAVTSKVVLVRGKDVALDASAEKADVVLAGKGFNKSIEDAFSELDQSLNYAAVNEMELYQVNPEALESFIKAGRLIP